MRKFCHGGQFKCPVCSDYAAQSLKRCRWLRLMHDAFDNHETNVITPLRPLQPAVPNLGLPVSQSFTGRRAITKKIRFTISGNGGGKTSMIRRDPVNGGIIGALKWRPDPETAANQIALGANWGAVKPFALINRTDKTASLDSYNVHSGPFGAFDGTVSFGPDYDDVTEAGQVSNAGKTDWIGFTDVYWMTTLIPEQGQPFTAVARQGDWIQIAGGGWVNAHYVTAN